MLRPTWKFLNATLESFTEQACYRTPSPQEEDHSESSADETAEQSAMTSTSVEALAFHSLELLATLVQRANLRQLVMAGLVPLTTTVCAYLTLEASREKAVRFDAAYFFSEKQDMLREISVRGQCLVILNNLVEVFGDAAVQAILLFVQNVFLKAKSSIPATSDSGPI